ncbi:hypothetical protein [Micromonospora haikouensis]|uniref:hypothetical protein n=1 Tax=Micromonospora haikouensis TaxID=686309 RepID=UPI003D74A13F
MFLLLARFTVKRYDPRQPRDGHGRWTPTPGGESARPGRLGLGDLMPQQPPSNRREWQATKQRAGEGVARALDGEYAGISVIVDQPRVHADVDQLAFTADLILPSGRPVGKTAAEFERRDGQLVAEFLLLSLDSDVQGQGFSGRFVGEMEAWCRESGVAYIGLDAGLSGGGYAWASRGYDWWDEQQALRVLPRLAHQVDEFTARLARVDPDGEEAERLAEQVASAQAILDRMRGEQFGSADYPTPYEVSQAGRRPGQPSVTAPDQWWIGKAATMGSKWRGVKIP